MSEAKAVVLHRKDIQDDKYYYIVLGDEGKLMSGADLRSNMIARSLLKIAIDV